jgi:hypothetical protein
MTCEQLACLLNSIALILVIDAVRRRNRGRRKPWKD